MLKYSPCFGNRKIVEVVEYFIWSLDSFSMHASQQEYWINLEEMEIFDNSYLDFMRCKSKLAFLYPWVIYPLLLIRSADEAESR